MNKYELGGNAIKKIRGIEHITDEELSAGISIIKQSVRLLSNTGDVFYLTRAELSRILDKFLSIQDARKRYSG